MNLSDFVVPTATPEVAKPTWISAPCGVTRDSDPLTRANFDAMCDEFDEVDPYGNYWEVLRFSQHDVGWLELVFVSPGGKMQQLCDSIRERMKNYPCLNEDLWVEYDEAEQKGVKERDA